MIWQQILSPLLTVLIKKLILVPKCRCFKHNFDLEYEDLLFQLMMLGWSAPSELCFIIAGHSFCLLSITARQPCMMGPSVSCSSQGLFSWASRYTWYLCSHPQRACVPAPGMHRAHELNVNLVSCQVRVGSMEMETSPARRTSLLFGILSWITQIARVSTF